MLLIYPGPSEAVVIDGITAARGVPVEIPAEHVTSLLEQGWTKPKPRKAPAAKKTAGAKKSPGRKATPDTPQEG